VLVKAEVRVVESDVLVAAYVEHECSQSNGSALLIEAAPALATPTVHDDNRPLPTAYQS
jgi:hypothetical protein